MDETTSTKGNTSHQSDPSLFTTDQGFIIGDSLASTDFNVSNAPRRSSNSTTNVFTSNASNEKEEKDYFDISAYSPTAFKTPTNKIRVEPRSSHLDWSIEHKSLLFPAKIDESFFYDSPVNNDKSLKLQQDVDKFWRNSSQIAPSPMVMMPNHVKGPSFSPSPANSNFIITRRTCMKAMIAGEHCSTPVSRNKNMYLDLEEREVQTDISIPADSDFDFAAVVQQALQRRRVASTPQKKLFEEHMRVSSPDASIIHHSPRNLFGDYSFEDEDDDQIFSTSPVTVQRNAHSFRGDVGTSIVSELISFDSFGLPPMSPIEDTLSESQIPNSPPPTYQEASPEKNSSHHSSPPQAISSFSNSGMPRGHDHLETISED